MERTMNVGQRNGDWDQRPDVATVDAVGGHYGLVEGLRVLAACGVIWAHLPGATAKEFGHGGLIAFVLLTTVFQTTGAARYDFREFLHRRSLRILVPWVAWFVFYAAANFLKGDDWFPHSKGFLPNLLTGPWIGLWFLPFILLISPMVYWLGRLSVIGNHCLWIGGFSLTGSVMLVSASVRPAGALGSPLDQWVQVAASVPFGMAFGKVLGIGRRNRIPWLLVPVGLGLIACYLARDGSPAMAVSYAVALIPLAVCFAWLPRLPSWLATLGSLCLGVYLVHPLFVSAIGRLAFARDCVLVYFAAVSVASFAAVALMRRSRLLSCIV
jgi:peptidoglycan/LPS O-acetylase OafA/YrhL